LASREEQRGGRRDGISNLPLLAIAAILGGTGTLVWYARLSREEQEEADRKANEYAMALFSKRLEELTKAQAKQIPDKVKRELLS
jgi:cytoskeletal protein RodZ